MKTLFAVSAILLLFSTGFAQQPLAPPGTGRPLQGPQQFESRKLNIMAALDRRISVLLQAKACVSRAQNPQALERCREDAEKRR
ncbi:MAG TPA: hypothetical protein VMT62_08405 [Syntrophorhabdaceae bacterium]|nr:hypothetical protein [Syntrophorhabdaceae bacterium]